MPPGGAIHGGGAPMFDTMSQEPVFIARAALSAAAAIPGSSGSTKLSSSPSVSSSRAAADRLTCGAALDEAAVVA